MSESAATILASLAALTTDQGQSGKSKKSASKIAREQTNRQRKIFHSLHALRQACLAGGKPELQECESGLVAMFSRLLATPSLHHVLTSATSQAIAGLYVDLCKTLYSTKATDALVKSLEVRSLFVRCCCCCCCCCYCCCCCCCCCCQQLMPLPLVNTMPCTRNIVTLLS